ncbi:hypothetical protein EYZ11_010226 [Aspergillus tanneri]|uniref:NAD-dependent epimerase/dehydratase domain-containing protein n=1 Tax=Aspergillus tanneri TaxID=1220188 RepID=A0A4S3J5W5_9EURO|nr:hypothetical protein EYZ11_010226 [Aspergillus tanneri]
MTRTVLVTGANGYIDATPSLAREEIIPVLGSPGDCSFLPALLEQQRTFDVIVSTTEQVFDYEPHFQDIIATARTIAESSNASGVRPLLVFTSGCKDYGMTSRADSSALSPHTEESPLNPPSVLIPRAMNAIKVFEHRDVFDAVVVRPTTVYGKSSSYYGAFLELAQLAREQDAPLKLPAHPKSVVHGTHVDDCADGYVRIAEADRRTVASQCYNISGWRYETLDEVAEALVKEYGITKGVIYEPPKKEGFGSFDVVGMLTGFSQWVSSEKLRQETGWKDRRLLFSQGVKSYRIAYEQAVRDGHSNVLRVKEYIRQTGN